jgi:hypothetical protein
VQHLCHDFGEEGLPARYRPMRVFVEEETLLHEDPARVRAFFAEAEATARDAGVSLRLPPLHRPARERANDRPRCDWPWRGAYLSYAGQAMPCCMVATPDRINFGDMIRDGVDAVWSNDAYRRFREGLANDEPHPICRSCAVYRGTF